MDLPLRPGEECEHTFAFRSSGMATIKLNITGIDAPSRDKAHLEVKRLAGEALSGAVGFEVDDLVTTREPVEPRGGVVTMVPVEWHAHLTVRHHF